MSDRKAWALAPRTWDGCPGGKRDVIFAGMNAEIQAAHEDATRVVKKQRICAENTAASLEALIALVSELQQKLQRGESFDAETLKRELEQLQTTIDNEELFKSVNKDTRELHSAISKLGKVVDGYFLPDISLSTRELDFESSTLKQVIVEHLFKEGQFRVGEAFAQESRTNEPLDIKRSYECVQSVLEEIRGRNLDPALKWAVENRSKISKDGSPSDFEFKLHGLRYLQILRNSGQIEALRYCQAHFPPFLTKHMPEIQRLTGQLVYAKRPIGKSPYRDTYDLQWEQAATEFVKQACNLIGQAHHSPLLVTVAAGSVVLPQLLRLADVMVSSGRDIKQCAQLPLEVELGREFQFHSIFACPVSKDQSSSENPPMLMPCGHVLCEHSITKISKQKNRPFKCPYCPVEAVPNNCRKLVFPDVIE